eukprot:3713714-Prymnesium_polylepis.1
MPQPGGPPHSPSCCHRSLPQRSLPAIILRAAALSPSAHEGGTLGLCAVVEPMTRPTADQLMEHAWLKAQRAADL